MVLIKLKTKFTYSSLLARIMKINVKSKIITTDSERRINIRVDVTSTRRDVKIEKKVILEDDGVVLIIRNLTTNKTVRINLPY
jgi:hypothetical protein